ncbi:MAG: helix-turn-helix domain-containing protein [Planctomycetes bacterium]|nr:helix-turn-helix domain-containing protein [Planctomycetota bacterium]
MIDREGINKRYLSCFPGVKPIDLANMLGVKYPTVYQWITNKRKVPWDKLNDLTSTQGISWDWLLEGRKPKHKIRKKVSGDTSFDRPGITVRFFSLYPECSQKKIGDLLGVSQMTVYRWYHNISPVPWEKLKIAVDEFNVTWEWLLKGDE